MSHSSPRAPLVALCGAVAALLLAGVVPVAPAWADTADPAAAPVALPAVEIPPEPPPEIPATLEELGAAHEALRQSLLEKLGKAKDRLDALDRDITRINSDLSTLKTLANDGGARIDDLEKKAGALDKRVPEVREVYGVATAAVVIVAVVVSVFLVLTFMIGRDVRREIDTTLQHAQERAIERVDDSLRRVTTRTDEALERSLKSIETAQEAEAAAMGLRTARAEVDALRTELGPLADAVNRLRKDLDHYTRIDQAEKNPRVLLVAAETARTHGEAMLYLEQLVDLDTSADILFSAAALAHQEYKNVPLAVKLYEKGLEKAKDRLGARAVYLSLLAYMPERREQAKTELTTLARKYRDDTLLACLFNFFIRAGDDAGHRDAARALLDGSKGSAIIHRNLAAALTKTAGDPAEIRKHFELALSLDETGESLSAYADWLVDQGRHKDAEAVVRDALAKQPLQHEYRVLLGRVLWAEGDLASARAEYQKVVDRAESDPLSGRAARHGLEEVAMAEVDRAARPA